MGKAMASSIRLSCSGVRPSASSDFSSGNIAKDTTGFPSGLFVMASQARFLCLSEEVLLNIAETIYSADEDICNNVANFAADSLLLTGPRCPA